MDTVDEKENQNYRGFVVMLTINLHIGLESTSNNDCTHAEF